MEEVNEKTIKEIFYNIINAIVIILYFFILNILYDNNLKIALERVIEIFTMIFLFIAIYFFEKSYRNDEEKPFLSGIESLVLSSLIMTINYIVKKFGFEFKAYGCTISYIFSIYFILKSIIIYTKERSKIEKSLTDIPEILKKETPKKKEAMKTKEREQLKRKQSSDMTKKEEIKRKTAEQKTKVNKK